MKLVYIIILVMVIGGFIGYGLDVDMFGPTNLTISRGDIEDNNEIEDITREVQYEQEVAEVDGEYVIEIDGEIIYVDTVSDAIAYAKDSQVEEAYVIKQNQIIWNSNKTNQNSVKLQIPHIRQYPELPRGCEVTALAMILQYYGVDVDKMQLAEEIKKDTTSYSVDENGRIYYGNPYEGFVGDMYNLKNRGYAVYHGPVAELAREYVGESVVDATGVEFEDILKIVELGYPVWVVTNATYQYLPEEEFQIWHTPTGIVKITMRMHSVVITGYEEGSLYINDPLYHSANRKVELNGFKESWEQMGSQAIFILEQ